MPDKILQNKFNVPIQMTDLSIFDDAVSTMKERFVAKIKRLDAEITKFRVLLRLPRCCSASTMFAAAWTDDFYAIRRKLIASLLYRLRGSSNSILSDLMHIYGQASTMQTGVTSSKRDTPQTSWDNITSSPLVEGDEDNKSLKLQFDVSQFDPNEVTVIVLNDTLVVSATHEEKTNNSMVFREYKREFLLPKGIDPQAIVSCLSKDGVLTVQASLPCQA